MDEPTTDQPHAVPPATPEPDGSVEVNRAVHAPSPRAALTWLIIATVSSLAMAGYIGRQTLFVVRDAEGIGIAIYVGIIAAMGLLALSLTAGGWITLRSKPMLSMRLSQVGLFFLFVVLSVSFV